jgi:hypothetical protein
VLSPVLKAKGAQYSICPSPSFFGSPNSSREGITEISDDPIYWISTDTVAEDFLSRQLVSLVVILQMITEFDFRLVSMLRATFGESFS